MRFASFVTRSVLGLALLAAPAPGFAAPFGGALSKGPAGEAAGNSSLVLVQHHRHGGGHYRGGYRGGRGGYYGGGDDGGAIAAGAIFGLALGAIVAGQAQQRSVGSCAQRFRSYDPGSMTYLGYDGRRHSCP
jgi:hypothetical protein